MVQPWHGSRGDRGRSAHQRVSAKLDQRSLVWTPALAASHQTAPPGIASASAPSSASPRGEMVKTSSISSSRKDATAQPIVKAKMSMRKAAEAVEAASKKSLEEIEANLELAKKRLEEVIEQEKEVKAIVDDHLAQEAMLQKLLDHLYGQQRDEAKAEDERQQTIKSNSSTANEHNVSVPARHDSSRTSPAAAETDPPTRDARAVRDHAPASAAKTNQIQKTVAGTGSKGSSKVPSAARGSGAHGPLPAGLRTAGPGMLLAMAIGGAEDGLLTRDAATMEEFIMLMSTEVLLKEGNKEQWPLLNERWRQPGLSISEALDRASGFSERPPRPPNLLTLAAHVRPLRASTRTSAATAASKHKIRGTTSAPVNSDHGTAMTPGTTKPLCSETGEEVALEGGAVRKRRRVDPNAIMCPFELGGVCNDDDCRYQHMDVYLPATTSVTPSTAGGIPWSAGEATPRTSGESGLKDPRTGPVAASSTSSSQVGTAAREERALQRERHLPEIQFDEPSEPESGEKRGGEREVKRTGIPPDEAGTKSDQGSTAKEAAALAIGEWEHGGSSSLTGSVEVADGGGGAMAEGDTGRGSKIAQQVSGAATRSMSVSEIARSFAQAVSEGSGTEDPRGGKGKGIGRREERYYDGTEQGNIPTAERALTKEELSVLENRLLETGCDVEGWLLLAMHRLPRNGDSAAAVLNTVKALENIGKGPGAQGSDAALRAALRVLVRGLERSQQGKAEELWMMYLSLFARVPNLGVQELVNMAEDVLERTWKLTRSIISTSRGRSLADAEALYRDRLQILLQMSSPVDEVVAGRNAADAPGAGSGAASEGQVSPGGELIGMMVYLVLERAAVLTEGGYVLQAIVQVLDALGERNALRSYLGEGDPETRLLRLSSSLRHDAAEVSRNGDAGMEEVGAELPEGVAGALKESSHSSRCLLWLTALHLLVMGTFPIHVLDVADGLVKDCGEEDAQGTSSRHSRASCLDLLRWPAECLSPQSAAGQRLSSSDELRNATTRTFMIALKDAALLPAESGGGRWAPPLRVRDALIPSTDEAAAARAGNMAPEPSALEGPGLVLALNWLTFCCRGEKCKELEVRTVALACCRRFQLARPDHPVLLAHNLLEHHTLKVRLLDDIYREISEAFDSKGAAAEAIRDRGEVILPEDLGDGGFTPAAGRLEAVYAFLRFIEAREVNCEVDNDFDDDDDDAMSATTPAAKPGFHAEAKAARDREVEVTRAAVREALMSLWVRSTKPAPDGQSTSMPDRWLRGADGEPLRRALERAKASLFRWADGRNSRDPIPGTGDAAAMSRTIREDDGLGAGRQLSVLFAALWILGGPSTATGALDHILSAESFSGMPPARRRQSWLHRLEVAVVFSESELKSGGKDSVNAVREVALRALADPRARPRPEYSMLAQYVASTLETLDDDPPLVSGETMFVRDILRIYADHFQAVRGGVDWVVVAEALGGAGGRRGDGTGRANDSSSDPIAPYCVFELLRWVDRADELPGAPAQVYHSSSANASPATLALRSNARPYARRALKSFPGDAGLAGAVAALEVATGRPGNAQRVLEAALRRRPESSALWEQRIALEAAFGAGSGERASITAGVAASTGALLRLRSPRREGPGVSELSISSPRPPDKRMTGRVLAMVSNPLLRTVTKSLSLQGSGLADLASNQLPPEIPRTLFLLTELVSLSLAGNRLTTLPAALGRLLSLRALDVSGNMLTTLPSSLSALSGSLRVLRLAGNRLASPLPVFPLGKLVSLRLLDLEGNILSEFPTIVLKMLELRTLKLDRNPFPPCVPPGLSDKLLYLEELTLPSEGDVASAGNPVSEGGGSRAESPSVSVS